MKTFFYFLSVVMILAVWSCETETLAPQDTRLGLDYYPITVGDYHIYEVRDIQYIFGQDPDTANFQMKEVVADSFYSQTNELTYRLERYSRLNDTRSWELDSIWTSRKSTSRVVVVENNIPLVKLVFPFSLGLTWDGNALNSREEQLYSLADAESAALPQNVTLSSPLDSLLGEGLTVIQQMSQDTIINDIRKLETYVEGIGLLYKKSLNLQYCASDASCVGLGIIESGRDYQQILTEYGRDSP